MIALTAYYLSKDRELRGRIVQSKDGKTYLVVADDNGGGCDPIFVDGEKWPHKISQAGEISPGQHTIKCGGEIEFEIPKATIYTFDYWGP
jgi:hypothetical protein